MPTRSGLVQMDEVEGLRLKLSPEDSVSLAPSLAEPINLEGQLVTVSEMRSFWKLPVHLSQHHDVTLMWKMASGKSVCI